MDKVAEYLAWRKSLVRDPHTATKPDIYPLSHPLHMNMFHCVKGLDVKKPVTNQLGVCMRRPALKSRKMQARKRSRATR